MCPISFIFLGQLLVMVLSGSCVTAPPYTAGMLLPFTACVTERKILLQLSKVITMSSEDTQTFHGVNDRVTATSLSVLSLSPSHLFWSTCLPVYLSASLPVTVLSVFTVMCYTC